MTKYKLPAALGGALVEAVGTYTTAGRLLTDVRVPELGVVPIPHHLLIDVPPLRKEPPTGSAVAVDHSVWLRGHAGWFDGFGIAIEAESLTWEQLNDRHPYLRPLIFDPADTAPDLPFRCEDLDEDTATTEVVPVDGRPAVQVCFDVQAVRVFSPETAFLWAAAILRAAREASLS